ncbi:putative TIM-barrel protein, nifR3 family [Eubacterium oxidoreducens]|uniref:tRNA-dihydrouridine synthase n=2 Tax=Eubacterium oxidoreducens TaxID=1732 RepID=A0A1G6A0A8_EUBOX|nr:tRNA dihydrouridine synthase DusB [Eubacterium oxidoreducens]SDB01825.1 putative TIM-barrel protein, nifR3 family [Eubacterium oxidoreducens]
MAVIHPLLIGDVQLKNNLVLAPMAGVSDLPFRLLCARMGAGLVCMEMVSAKAILYKNKNTKALMQMEKEEKPVSLQLFGSDPDILADITARVSELDYDFIDFNMGCPMPKIVNNGEGSALMKEPKLVEEILTKMVKASKRPVTVKIRKGFNDEQVNAVEIAKIAQSCGVSAVAVHGRTREQYYSGKADWEIIRQVKEALTIPVLGNGDLCVGDDLKRMQEVTGCDGYLIGRAARGNPWIFRHLLSWAQTGTMPPKPTGEEVVEMILEHAKLQIQVKGEFTAIRELRKHAAWYTSGYPNSAQLRARVNEVETFEELKALFGELSMMHIR